MTRPPCASSCGFVATLVTDRARGRGMTVAQTWASLESPPVADSLPPLAGATPLAGTHTAGDVLRAALAHLPRTDPEGFLAALAHYYDTQEADTVSDQPAQLEATEPGGHATMWDGGGGWL